jgi:membrane protein DedA with SNARE-associated domain
MHTVNLLVGLVENHQVLAYIAICVGLIFEGELFLITTGILLHLGALSFIPALFFVFLGLLCKTFAGYHIGIALHNKWKHTKLLKHIEKRISSVMPHFKERPFWSIFVSKFIMGINNVVIIFSGYHKIDFKKYLKAEFLSSIIWVPALISLGYLFSHTAINISREIWRFSFIVLLLVTLFFIFDKLVSWIYELFEEFHDHSKNI